VVVVSVVCGARYSSEPAELRKTVKQARSLQAELQTDLLPIISRAERVNAAEAYTRISRLIDKINEMRLETKWALYLSKNADDRTIVQEVVSKPFFPPALRVPAVRSLDI